MRPKIFFPIIIALLLFSILDFDNIYSQSNPLLNKFSVGFVNWLLNPKYHTTNHGTWYSQLNIDIQQSYSFRGDIDEIQPNGKKYYGGFKDNINNYKDNVNESIVFQNTPKLFERAKIVRGAYGQRSTYQAEPIASEVFPQYGYSVHGLYVIYSESLPSGENISGVVCTTGNAPGYIVSGLIENCEQTNRPTVCDDRTGDIEYMISDNKSATWNWYIKPRMRIPMSVVNDVSFQSLPDQNSININR
jgi:hypothetical protein